MAAIDVLLVGSVEDSGAIRSEADVFYLEVTGSEQQRCTTRSRHGIEMRPAVTLPREDKTIVGCPQQEMVSVDLAEGAASALVGLPYEVALSGGCVRNADGPGAGCAVVGRWRLR